MCGTTNMTKYVLKIHTQNTLTAMKVKVVHQNERQSSKFLISHLTLRYMWNNNHYYQSFGNPQDKSTHTKTRKSKAT